MSKGKCMRCDKCGELIIGDDPHGTFRGALWPSEIESFDLCRDCSVEVQRFIHGRNEVKAHIPYRGKPADECPDGPRYKAIGNSMAVPVMRFIGERIAMAEAGEIA